MNMAEKYDLLFYRMIEYIASASCDINNETEINDIAKACTVKLTSITSSFKNMW